MTNRIQGRPRREDERDGDASSPIARVRGYLRRAWDRESAPADWRVLEDLRALAQRLWRAQSRLGGGASVEFSPQMQEALRTFKVVGNELLVLAPEREGV